MKLFMLSILSLFILMLSCNDPTTQEIVKPQTCLTPDDCSDDEICKNNVCVKNTVKQCITNSDCDTGYQCGDNGYCIEIITCSNDSECLDGYRCNLNGYCELFICSNDDDCGSKEICESGSCIVGCHSTAQCEVGENCNTTLKKCESVADCRLDGCDNGLVCNPATGVCEEDQSCYSDSECPNGFRCNLVTNDCEEIIIECNIDSDCEIGEICENNLCVELQGCRDDNDCLDSSKPACNSASGICYECMSDSHCTNGNGCDLQEHTCTASLGCEADSDCGLNKKCDTTVEPHQCVSIFDCTIDSDCSNGMICENGTCVSSSNPCDGVTCSNHGTCVNTNGVASCNCNTGYHAVGLTCVVDTTDPCSGVTCSYHGDCVNTSGVASCDCDSGYHAVGLTCVVDSATCSDDSNQNNSYATSLNITLPHSAQYHSCATVYDYFKVTLGSGQKITASITGFTGDLDLFLTNTEVSSLYSSSTGVVASSTSATGTTETVTYTATASQTYYIVVKPYSSTTDTNYTLSASLVTTDPCSGVTCSNHGTCVNTNGVASCNCDTGYHAVSLTCVADTTDPCSGVTCSNHGTCVNTNGVASCNCDTGYHAVSLTCVADTTTGGGVGAACEDSSDCEGTDAFCSSYSSNGYCTATCTIENAPCLDGGKCFYFNSTDVNGYCLKTCLADSSCGRDELVCYYMDSTFGSACSERCYTNSECNSDYCDTSTGHCDIEYTSCDDDPVYNSGCDSGKTCWDDGDGYGTYCYPNGGKLNGESCEYADDCITGSGCVGNSSTGYYCREYCYYTANCSTGSCTLFSDEDYGYCK
ncbi:PPC domain-containing protein [bacterium]|nr:PPC domain-containing protein [bacterium]